MTKADEEIAIQAVKSLGAGPAAVELYRDLLQPAAKEMGANLLNVARAVSLAMLPLKGAVWGFEEIRDWVAVKLTEKLKSVRAEEIHPPKMTIAGPALLGLHFCKDEAELRELFANLLASSMAANISSSVHPSFVHIIQQLNADEAKILRWLADNLSDPQVCYERVDSNGKLVNSIENAQTTIKRIAVAARLEQPEKIDTYFDNLLRLRIFEQKNIANQNIFLGATTNMVITAHRYLR